MNGHEYGGDGRQQGRLVPPVGVGDEIDVKIEAVGEKGDGVARRNGFVIFVPNTKEGDTVKIKVTKVLRKVGFAEVVGQAESVPESEASQDESSTEEEQAVEEAPKHEVPEQDSEDFGEDDEEKRD